MGVVIKSEVNIEMIMKHLVLNLYSNGEYVFESVSNSELRNYIEHNKKWRFGRLIYVDGKRVYNGCIEKDALGQYDAIAKKFFAEHNTMVLS